MDIELIITCLFLALVIAMWACVYYEIISFLITKSFELF